MEGHVAHNAACRALQNLACDAANVAAVCADCDVSKMQAAHRSVADLVEHTDVLRCAVKAVDIEIFDDIAVAVVRAAKSGVR